MASTQIQGHEERLLVDTRSRTKHHLYWAVTGPIMIYLKCSIGPMPIYPNILIGPTVCRFNRYWPNSKLGNRPIAWKNCNCPVKINDVEFRVVIVVMIRKFANGGPITVCLSGWRPSSLHQFGKGFSYWEVPGQSDQSRHAHHLTSSLPGFWIHWIFILGGWRSSKYIKNTQRPLRAWSTAWRVFAARYDSSVIERVAANVVKRAKLNCLDAKGGHFQHLLK